MSVGSTLNLFREARNAVRLPAGEVVFREGEPGNCMYVLLEGEVEFTVEGRWLRTLGPGALFGEMSLVDDSPRSATATAKTAVRLVSLDERRFKLLVQETPFFALQVMRVMAGRLRDQTSRPG